MAFQCLFQSHNYDSDFWLVSPNVAVLTLRSFHLKHQCKELKAQYLPRIQILNVTVSLFYKDLGLINFTVFYCYEEKRVKNVTHDKTDLNIKITHKD
jgi:hypothetical protein